MPRIGLSFESHLPLDLMREAVKAADEQGYEVCWMPGEESPGKELPTQHAAFAMATSRIKVATGILTIYTRPPTLIAQTATSLDEISDGRFMLGLGTGHAERLQRNHGIRLERPFQRMREYVQVIRRILSDGWVSYQGKLLNIPNFQLAAAPPERPIPIYLAALGPQMAALAGEIADGVLLNMGTVEYLRDVIPRVKDAARNAGRDPDKVDIACLVAASSGGSEAEWACRERISSYIGSPFYQQLLRANGFGTEVDRIVGSLKSGDRQEATRRVTDRMLDALSLAGDPSRWAEKLERYRSAGVDLPCLFISPSGPDPTGSVLNSVRSLKG
ncbi:MAG: LLM class flavin-dependent oxidoreductase [Dehalococcoidia bacterium]|nr:LLM class flavin-dependent oxidoreductase [Dehalococcoidia bacterium]